MIFTDKKAISIFKRLKMAELIDSIKEYPEDERDGRNDLQFLADEISYFKSCYEEDGHVYYDSLTQARELLRKTKNGKILPIDPRTMKYKRGYYPVDIEIAKSIISEYNQLGYYKKRLLDIGYTGKW